MKKIEFMDTSFRDGFQSFFGARVLTDDIIPAIEAAREAGITQFEAGGGARFQSLFLYCGESAFDMMDRFRIAAGPDASLQTLARGINGVALNAQPRDMLDLHAKTFRKHGIDQVRNFDALNDVRNLTYSGQAIKNAGMRHQVCVSMMELPPGISGSHDTPFYLDIVRQILDAVQFDSICLKDSTGTSSPQKIHATVRAIRELIGGSIQLWFHTHDTAGIGIAQYLAAIEAGCDGICLARAPVSGGTSQPDLTSMAQALKGSSYTLDVDFHKIYRANAVFKKCLNDYFFPPEATRISPEVIFSPMPGGALTANTMMMRDTGTLHLYPEVIEAMAECVARGGFGASVTPVSQFYFQQAYSNVTNGPWKKITEGYGKMVLGYYGKTPAPPDPEIVQLAQNGLDLPPFTGDPLDQIAPGIPRATEMLRRAKLPITDENLMILGAFETPGGNKGLDYLKGTKKISVRKGGVDRTRESSSHGESVHEKEFYTVTVNGKPYEVSVEPATGEPATIRPIVQQHRASGTEVRAPLPGNIYAVMIESGKPVKKGEPIIIIEAMKMETGVTAPADGIIEELYVAKGQMVQAGDLLVRYR